MNIDRRLQAAVEAVDELWQDEEETAQRYQLFLASLQFSPLPDTVTAAIDGVLQGLRDEVGASLYFAVYEEGEVRMVAESSGPATPPVEEWADFRASAHAHSFGQCLLAQLDEDALRDHFSRHPIVRLTPHTITSEPLLVHRLRNRSSPASLFLDLQEYSLGWASAAVSVTADGHIGAVAAYLPAEKLDFLKYVGDFLLHQVRPALDLALKGRSDQLPENLRLKPHLPTDGDRTIADMRSQVGGAMAKGS